MSLTKHNSCIDVTDTVSVLSAPESNFQALADRASELTHHNERKSCMDEEGMIPHN